MGAAQISAPDDVFEGKEISIRGAAGPYCIVASNFAPGTTSADIESVMAPIGGEMLACKLISSHPTVIAEMIFTERSGADNVIAMFNNKKVCQLRFHLIACSTDANQADGRVLYVYFKEGGPSQPVSAAQIAPRTSSPAHSRPMQPSAPAMLAVSPHPAQESLDDVMEIESDAAAAAAATNQADNEAAFAVNADTTSEDAHNNGAARPRARGNEYQTRAPRDPRDQYRPFFHDDRPSYREDYGRGPRQANPEVQDGRYGFPDQDFSPRDGGYGGRGYDRYDRGGGRFRESGRMYSDSMGRGGSGRFRR